VKSKIDLVIFDVDGVIFDSEPLHYRAKLEILRSYGLNETFDLKEYVGKPNKDLWSKIITENNLKVDPDKLEMRQFNLILGYIFKEHLTPTKGLWNY
jgi:beta-phosphoglucomutase-like phosphatase (HAD superfamily)